LRKVEISNSWPVMLSGIRFASAINVGTEPLAFMFVAISYGELIFAGIYLIYFASLMLGASATALFALILDTLVAWFGRGLCPDNV
ncbi:glycine/betaine ABC transporter permease, partial [Salmonella enterica subsp. enterica serovar Infantis]